MISRDAWLDFGLPLEIDRLGKLGPSSSLEIDTQVLFKTNLADSTNIFYISITHMICISQKP